MFRVKDAKKSLDFYQNVLGMELREFQILIFQKLPLLPSLTSLLLTSRS
jgi:catechol 2,3-dioxygenase-like lactoylglutathione lyase family enzyme